MLCYVVTYGTGWWYFVAFVTAWCILVLCIFCSPCSRPVMLGSAESEHPRLTNGEIIFEEFQPVWSQSTNVTDRRTDGQTTCDRKTALCTIVHRAVKIEDFEVSFEMTGLPYQWTRVANYSISITRQSSARHCWSVLASQYRTITIIQRTEIWRLIISKVIFKSEWQFNCLFTFNQIKFIWRHNN